MDINLVRSLFTLVLFVAFIILCFWAYSPKRRVSFEKASMLPFDESPGAGDDVRHQPQKTIVGECSND